MIGYELQSLDVSCSGSEKAVGGGFNVVDPDGNQGAMTGVSSLPLTNGIPSVAGETPNGWRATAQGQCNNPNDPDFKCTYTVYVICIP